MITLKSKTDHKSISGFGPVTLPPFTIITGENGAGKSQLLDAIEKGHVSVDGLTRDHADGVALYRSERIRPSGGQIDLRYAEKRAGELWDDIEKTWHQHRDRLKSMPFFAGANTDRLHVAARRTQELHGDLAADEFKNQLDVIGQQIRQSKKSDHETAHAIEQVEQSAGVTIAAFDEWLFREHYRPRLEKGDSLNHPLTQVFGHYHYLWWQNEERAFLQSRDIPCSSLAREEFARVHGEPPWTIVNRILELSELEFRVDAPSFRDRHYKLKFRNRQGHEISPDDLSSGEKILVALALALYYHSDPRQPIQRSSLILFDEPDASLHPSMTTKMLRVLQTIFVKDNEIPVIVTTHSPSTVALAPPESVFLMRKHEPRLEKVDVDAAIRHLLVGVPSISVQATHRRQVFVESDNDVSYYELIKLCLYKHLVPEIGLHFLAVGTARGGGCDTVKKVVQQLRDHGNLTVFGAIDSDRTNRGSPFIKVLGDGNRYSIENFILDPLLLGVLLLRDHLVSADWLGLPAHTRHFELANKESQELQTLASRIVTAVDLRPNKNEENDGVVCHYVCGKSVTLPRWYLTTQGHKLEDWVVFAFAGLNRYSKTGDLKLNILRSAAQDVAGLIPVELLTLLHQIQTS
jgi:ABC-type lipoprotein export system ATPase subunit